MFFLLGAFITFQTNVYRVFKPEIKKKNSKISVISCQENAIPTHTHFSKESVKGKKKTYSQ